MRPVTVRVGLTDGLMTEIQGNDVTEGMAVVTDTDGPAAGGNAPAAGASPFTPQLPRGRPAGR